MEEERFVLDNNDNVIDFEDKTDKYCLSQEDVCDLLNKQQTRIKELEDKDWYEANIKQLEEQNDRLIQERDNLKQQLEEKDEQINNLEQMCQICNKDQENEKLKQQLEEKDKEISKLQASCQQVKTQLAIQELAEIERLLYESHYKEIDNKYYAEYEDINSLIDSRIKALEELEGKQT